MRTIIERWSLTALGALVCACGVAKVRARQVPVESTPTDGGSLSATVETPDPFLRNVVQLSVGSAHACAVTTTHAVVCWGDNAAGELGVGIDKRYVGESLLRPHVVGGLPDIERVAAGQMHSCAIDGRGTVFCWGSAGGDLKATVGGVSGSIELRGNRLGTPVRMPLGGQAHVVAISRTGTTACAAFADDVQCWSTFQAIPINARTITLPALHTTMLAGVTALAMGHGKVCAIADTKLWCWHGDDSPTAAVWARGDAFIPITVAIGEMYACALSAAGEVRCWLSLIDDFWKKPPNRDVRWPNKPATRAVAVGDSPICTADATGVVDCFLSDEQGLPDDAAAASWATTSLGPHPIAGIDGAIDLGLGAGRNVMGFGFGCALRGTPDASGAQVFCWGDNESGELGNGTTQSTKTAVRVLGTGL